MATCEVLCVVPEMMLREQMWPLTPWTSRPSGENRPSANHHPVNAGSQMQQMPCKNSMTPSGEIKKVPGSTSLTPNSWIIRYVNYISIKLQFKTSISGWAGGHRPAGRANTQGQCRSFLTRSSQPATGRCLH